MSEVAGERNIPEEWDALLFGVQCSIRYHTRRQAFFQHWHDRVTAISVLFSSAAIVAVFSSSERLFGIPKDWSEAAVVIVAAIVSFTSTMDLVVGTTARASQHHDLARRWIGLERKMCRATNQDAPTLARFLAKRLAIEADEPPPLQVLHSICYNDLCRARALCTEIPLTWWQRRFADYRDLGTLPRKAITWPADPPPTNS